MIFLFLIPKVLKSVQFPIRMFRRIQSGRRITGLGTTQIHLISGSRISGALPTTLRGDAATEAALFCRASMLYEAHILQIDNNVLCRTTFNVDTNTKSVEIHGIGFDMEHSFGRQS